MRTKIKLATALFLFAAIFILHPPYGAQTKAEPMQQTGGDERGTVKSEEFVNSRPGSEDSNAKNYRYRTRKQTKSSSQSTKKTTTASTNQSPQARGNVYASIGVTIGRGRNATEVESKDNAIAKANICAERQEGKCLRWQDMVVERISDNATITDGTPIQMMIEYLASKDAAGRNQASNRVGYLYVINRVEFKDKSFSTPKLIFPTMHTFGGDNRVLPGKTVLLPEPQRLWQITRNKKATQEFETYIIIISPEPLKDSNGKDLQLSGTPLELDEGQVKDWTNRWDGGVVQSDLEQGVGQLFTKREQIAGGDPTKTIRDTDEMDTDLKKGDPPPQMVFSKVIAPNGTMLVTIKLPFKDTIITAKP